MPNNSNGRTFMNALMMRLPAVLRALRSDPRRHDIESCRKRETSHWYVTPSLGLTVENAFNSQGAYVGLRLGVCADGNVYSLDADIVVGPKVLSADIAPQEIPIAPDDIDGFDMAVRRQVRDSVRPSPSDTAD